MSNFRIIVLLHNFFFDVRSSSRVYITSEIKTIEHLKTHISQLFCLMESFYLTSNNFYLPDSEDIRILKEDDVVVVIRDNSSHKKVRNKHKKKHNFNELEYETELRKKSAVNYINCFDNSDNEITRTPVKKKKKQTHKSCESEEKQSAEEEHTKNPKCENMDVQDENNEIRPKNVKLVIKVNNCHQDNTEDISKGELKNCYENTADKKINKSEISNNDPYSLWHFKDVNTPFHTISETRFQKPIVASKKDIKPMKISREPKLIKSVVVSSSQSSVVLESDNNVEEKNTSLQRTYENESCKVSAIRSNRNINCKMLNDVDLFSESGKYTSEQKGSVQNAKLQNGSLETEQNLHTVINNSTLHKSSSILTTDLLLSPFSTKSKNGSINSSKNSYNDEGEYTDETEYTLAEDSSVSSLPVKRKRKRIRRRKPKIVELEPVHGIPIPKPTFTIATPAVHIRFDDINDKDKQINQIEPESSVHSEVNEEVNVEVNYEKLCKEEISKFPIMTEIFPKEGDIIAFKICKLSTAYTPEISDFIIAKVVQYCNISKNTCLKILEGIDNFVVPEGKFFMEDCDNQNEKEEKQICWNNLLEPRLLFP